jgi:hypothetical protein
MIRYTLLIQRINILIGAFFIISGTLFSQITVNSINELRGVNPGTNQTVQVRGYYEPGDWGDIRLYRWNQNSEQRDNGGTVILPNTKPLQGRWLMDVQEYYLNVKWFGARGRNNSSDNDYEAIITCIDEAAARNLNVFIPNGIYQLSNAIRITHLHNDIVIFGESVSEKYEMQTIKFGPRAGQREQRRVVDFSQSTVLRRADVGPYQSMYVLLTPSNSAIINNISLKNIVLDGNRGIAHNTLPSWDGNNEASHVILFNHGDNVGPEGITLDKVYPVRGGGYRGGNNVQIYGNNVKMKNVLSYGAYWHGISGRGKDVFIENVEIYDIEYQFGVDGGGESNFYIKDFYIHDVQYGVKTQNAERITLIDGKIRDSGGVGFRTGSTDSADRFVDIYMENMTFRDCASVGLHLGQELKQAQLVNIDLTNTSATFTQPNIEIFGLRSTEYKGENYPIRVYGNNANVIIHDLELHNSRGTIAGLEVFRGNATIRTGSIINNDISGIHIREGGTLHIFNTKFGDSQYTSSQTFHDIYGDGSLYHSELDFTESNVFPSDRIKVTEVNEVAYATIRVSGQTGTYFSEEGLQFEVFASAPNTNVVNIAIYADDIQVGNLSEAPYIFFWENMKSGFYSIYAIATFTNDSQEISNKIQVIITSRAKSQSIYLQPGWNMISSFVEPEIADISFMLSGIKSNIAMVTNNEGNVYWPSLEIDEIGEWNIHEGYQVYMESPDTLIITGIQQSPEQTTNSLSQGWNLTSYLIEESYPIEDALQSIQQAIQIVTDNSGQIFWPETGINTIGHMKPGQGYKIFLKSDAELIYPSVSVGIPKLVYGGGSIQKSDVKSLNSRRYIIEYGNTGVTSILLVESSRFIYGDEVGVWNESGVLVGSGVILNGKAAITIWGRNKLLAEKVFGADEQENLRLTLWSVGEQKEYPLKIVSLRTLIGEHRNPDNFLYESDAILIADVEIDNFIPERYTLKQNFPNPFNPSTTISYEIPREVHVKLEVYNLLGQRVQLLIDEVQQAGSHEFIFNSEDFASSVYLYRLQAGNYTETKKMILLR